MKKIVFILIMLTIYANSTTTEEIRKLCEAGDSKNCKIMGDLTRAGLGVEQDDAKAHYYYDKACFDGYKDACKELEEMRQK